MAWITSNSVSVSNGSKTVSVSGNVDLSSVDEGWGVQIGENKLVEASSGTAPNGSGVSTLTLFEPWPNGSVSAATMKIIPNSGYQIALAKRIKSIVDRTVDVMQLQHDYTSQLGQVTAVDPETNEQHIYNTLQQNQQEIAGDRQALASDYATKLESLTISATMGYRNAVERESGGKRTLIADVHGNLEQMCVFGRINYEDLELPELNLGTGTMLAFLTNGAPKSEIFISPYQSTLVNGVLVGIGGQYPTGSMNFDSMRNNYRGKGAGWRMISKHDWDLLRLISRKFNPNITGNTYYGRSHVRRYESATRQDGKSPGDTSSLGYTRAGAGPNAWSHDGTEFGVFDMVGNKWEWIDQFKISGGEIICTPDNQPDLDESLWVRQGVYYDTVGGSVQLSGSPPAVIASTNVANNSGIIRASSYTPSELMRRLGVEQDVTTSDGRLYVNSDGERFPIVGGRSSYTGNAGPLAFSATGPRSNEFFDIVSRSAYSA